MQAQLPFATTPKQMQKKKRKTLEDKRAIVLEPEEKKRLNLIQQLQTIKNEKMHKKKYVVLTKQFAFYRGLIRFHTLFCRMKMKEKLAKYKAQKEKEEKEKLEKEKARKKAFYQKYGSKAKKPKFT